MLILWLLWLKKYIIKGIKGTRIKNRIFPILIILLNKVSTSNNIQSIDKIINVGLFIISLRLLIPSFVELSFNL